MSGRNYDDALEITYHFPAASLIGGAVIGRFAGPAGMTGRVRSITGVTTTGITVLDSSVTVGAAGEAVAVTGTLPITAINLGVSATAAEIAAGTELLADTVCEVTDDGAPTAGAATLAIVVGWY